MRQATKWGPEELAILIWVSLVKGGSLRHLLLPSFSILRCSSNLTV